MTSELLEAEDQDSMSCIDPMKSSNRVEEVDPLHLLKGVQKLRLVRVVDLRDLG